MTFTVEIWLQENTEADLLSALQWIVANYPTNVTEARAGQSLAIYCNMTATDFNDAVSIITSFKTEFNGVNEIENYELVFIS